MLCSILADIFLVSLLFHRNLSFPFARIAIPMTFSILLARDDSQHLVPVGLGQRENESKNDEGLLVKMQLNSVQTKKPILHLESVDSK